MVTCSSNPLKFQKNTHKSTLPCLFANGWTPARGVIFSTFCKARFFTPSKPEGRAPKNSFWSESKSTLATFASTDQMQTVCENRAYFLLCIVQYDWFISDQLRYSLNIYKFDCLRWFAFSDQIKALNKSTKSTSCFIFLFEIAKITKLVKKKRKKARVGSSREIWWLYRETGRFDEKLGESRENRESWQVCPCLRIPDQNMQDFTPK